MHSRRLADSLRRIARRSPLACPGHRPSRDSSLRPCNCRFESHCASDRGRSSARASSGTMRAVSSEKEHRVMKVTWNETTVAPNEAILVVEGNHYLPLTQSTASTSLTTRPRRCVCGRTTWRITPSSSAAKERGRGLVLPDAQGHRGHYQELHRVLTKRRGYKLPSAQSKQLPSKGPRTRIGNPHRQIAPPPSSRAPRL